MFLSQVDQARLISKCHIVCDFNLDYTKWATPDTNHEQMITCTKNTLETAGFTQIIRDITRCWPGQNDSLVDHIWSNDTQNIINVTNVVLSVGDHNHDCCKM